MVLLGEWLKSNIFKVSVALNLKKFPLQDFIKYLHCMFWYLKFWTSIKSSVLFNKSSLSSKVWFIASGFSFNTEDNHNVTQGWKNLKFLCANACVLSWKFCCMHIHRKNVLLVRLCSEIKLYVVQLKWSFITYKTCQLIREI